MPCPYCGKLNRTARHDARRYKTFRVRLSCVAMKFRCPICRTPTDSEASADFPFCSERCRLLDLGNWSSEKYVIREPVLDEPVPENSGRSDPNEDEDNRKNG
jgi:endogenous inhibitor of DNA gyrase (YacG/DUF329 family)